MKLKISDAGYTSIFMMFTREIHKFELQIEMNECDPRCFFRSFFLFLELLSGSEEGSLNDNTQNKKIVKIGKYPACHYVQYVGNKS